MGVLKFIRNLFAKAAETELCVSLSMPRMEEAVRHVLAIKNDRAMAVEEVARGWKLLGHAIANTPPTPTDQEGPTPEQYKEYGAKLTAVGELITASNTQTVRVPLADWKHLYDEKGLIYVAAVKLAEHARPMVNHDGIATLIPQKTAQNLSLFHLKFIMLAEHVTYPHHQARPKENESLQKHERDWRAF